MTTTGKNFVMVDTDDLMELIHKTVYDAVTECLPAAIPEEKQFYTIKDVAQKWGVCEQTIWRYTKLGRIKAVKAGRLIRFEKAYIDGLKSLGEMRTVGRAYITKAEKNIGLKRNSKGRVE